MDRTAGRGDRALRLRYNSSSAKAVFMAHEKHPDDEQAAARCLVLMKRTICLEMRALLIEEGCPHRRAPTELRRLPESAAVPRGSKPIPMVAGGGIPSAQAAIEEGPTLSAPANIGQKISSKGSLMTRRMLSLVMNALVDRTLFGSHWPAEPNDINRELENLGLIEKVSDEPSSYRITVRGDGIHRSPDGILWIVGFIRNPDCS